MPQTVTYSGRSIEWNRFKGNAATEAKNIAWGDSASAAVVITGAANADVNLFDPLPEGRVVAASSIQTSGFLGDQYKLVGTIIASAPRNVREFGAFDSSVASPTTTFTGALTSGTTGTQTVGSTTNFPTSGTGNFYCQLENEVIVANTVNATGLGIVSRGALGTTAAAHVSGATVTLGGDGGAGTAGATSAQTAAVASGNGGNICWHADFGVLTLNTNDSVQFTMTDWLS